MQAPAIRAEGLTKRYGSLHALQGLSLEVAPGEVVGYLGPNGSGKTTTIRLLLGLIRPTAGRCAIFGVDSHRDPIEAHRHLAYVPGEANLWPSLTGAETLRLLGQIQGRVDPSYREELIRRFDFDRTKKVRAYSKGNRQKLILIGALMCRPDLLILDEPTGGLDPLMEQAFQLCVREARERGQAVFLSSHILSEVEALCDRVGILRAGVLTENGTLAEMRHLSAVSVEARFEGPAPDLARVPGVSAVVVEDHRLRCQVHGPIEAVLQALAGSEVRELLSRRPTLEELFLAHYGPGSGQGATAEGAVRRAPGEPRAERTAERISGSIPSPDGSGPATDGNTPAATPAAPPHPVAATDVPARELQGASKHPGTVIARRTARQALRSMSPWAVGFGFYIAASAVGYAGLYKTQAQRVAFARGLGSNLGIAALIGPARGIDTVAGFVSWRCLGVLSLVGAIWAIMAGTRLLRGAEEQGRWELLLAGQTTRRHAALQGLAGLGIGLAGLFGVTALLTLAGGAGVTPKFPATASLFMALSVVATTMVFLAVAALAGQLAATRRRAVIVAGVVLGAAYLLRAAADAGPRLRWLLWATPLGWAENLRPLVGSRPAWLIPIVASTAVLAALSVLLAGARDLGTGVLAAQDTAPARTLLLGSPTLMAARLGRSTAAVWLGAVAFSGLFFGDIARSAVPAISGSFQKDLGRIGAHRAGVEAMLGLIFLVLAVYLAIIAAGQIGAMRDEEATGRLDNLLVRPVSRWAWLAGRLAWSTTLVVACGEVAGLTMWLGSSIGGGGPSLGTVMAAGINIVPPALLLLGAGVLLLAAVPRLAPGILYGVIGWAFLVEFLGSVVKFSHWLLDTSVFFHMAPAPAADPNWASAAVMVALGVAAAAVGGLLFRRRDLASA